MYKYKIFRTNKFKITIGYKTYTSEYSFYISPFHISNYKINLNVPIRHIYIGTSLFKIDLYIDLSWKINKK